MSKYIVLFLALINLCLASYMIYEGKYHIALMNYAAFQYIIER